MWRGGLCSVVEVSAAGALIRTDQDAALKGSATFQPRGREAARAHDTSVCATKAERQSKPLVGECAIPI